MQNVSKKGCVLKKPAGLKWIEKHTQKGYLSSQSVVGMAVSSDKH